MSINRNEKKLNYLKKTIILFSFAEEKPGIMTVDTALDMLQTAASEIDEESEVNIIFENIFLEKIIFILLKVSIKRKNKERHLALIVLFLTKTKMKLFQFDSFSFVFLFFVN